MQVPTGLRWYANAAWPRATFPERSLDRLGGVRCGGNRGMILFSAEARKVDQRLPAQVDFCRPPHVHIRRKQVRDGFFGHARDVPEQHPKGSLVLFVLVFAVGNFLAFSWSSLQGLLSFVRFLKRIPIFFYMIFKGTLIRK